VLANKIINKYVGLVALILLTGCKNGAMLSETEPSNTQVSSNNAISSTSQSDESFTEVVSSADADSPQLPDAVEYTVLSGEFNFYPRTSDGWDESGWSIITPSEDSRLIYVDADSGSDETAEFYAPRDIADIYDPGLIKPYRTIEFAIENSRQGFPDWILLRRGQTWELPPRTGLKGGRSVDERSVVTAYGTAGNRPILSSSGKDILRIWAEKNYIAITSLSFYSQERDPESPYFAGWGNLTELNGLVIYGPENTIMGSILIEDNHFNYLTKGISVIGNGDHRDIVIRRNIIRNSYNDLGHSQGMSASKTSAFLEENIFDHNGWRVQQKERNGREKSQGQGTIYNHNTYFTKSTDTVFKNNIFLRPSSIHNKWTANPPEEGIDEVMSSNLIMENNLYVGGEIGISAGGNDDYNTGARWRNISIVDNIMLAIGRDQPTNRNLGWYIDTVDWEGGEVCGNYLLNNDNIAVQNINAIKINGHSSDMTISKNLIYGLKMTDSSAKNGAITIDGAPKNNIKVRDNDIQLSDSKMVPVIAHAIGSASFSYNTYFSDADEDNWFRVDGKSYSYNDWVTLTGDSGSTNQQHTFLSPERSFETYLSSIGLSPDIDSFIEAVADLPVRNWDSRLSAARINAYIREGYGNIMCK